MSDLALRPLLWVAGGRDFDDEAMVRRVLRPYSIGDDWMLVTGAARGVDLLAEHQWRLWNQPYMGIPADWNSYGKRAGYLRNKYIARLSPKKLIAFPGGRGTAMAVDLAVEFGIDFRVVTG
jgi:hypothetical protein